MDKDIHYNYNYNYNTNTKSDNINDKKCAYLMIKEDVLKVLYFLQILKNQVKSLGQEDIELGNYISKHWRTVSC